MQMKEVDTTVKPKKVKRTDIQPKLNVFFTDTQPQVHTSMKVNVHSTSGTAAKRKGTTTRGILEDAKQNPAKYIVSVTQNKDTSKELPLVPEGERETRLLYCEQCNFSTTSATYMRVHNTRQCPFLTVVERIKCPEDSCGRFFIREHNFQDHINTHLGISKHKCENCGQTFTHQNQLAHHKKSC